MQLYALKRLCVKQFIHERTALQLLNYALLFGGSACVCGGRKWPLAGQFVILRDYTVIDARTRFRYYASEDLPLVATLHQMELKERSPQTKCYPFAKLVLLDTNQFAILKMKILSTPDARHTAAQLQVSLALTICGLVRHFLCSVIVFQFDKIVFD